MRGADLDRRDLWDRHCPCPGARLRPQDGRSICHNLFQPECGWHLTSELPCHQDQEVAFMGSSVPKMLVHAGHLSEGRDVGAFLLIAGTTELQRIQEGWLWCSAILASVEGLPLPVLDDDIVMKLMAACVSAPA